MLLLQLFTLIKIWQDFFCFYLFWFCHLFKPCYAYIVQIQQITVRVISLTQCSEWNLTRRSPVCKTACRSFHFRNKNLDLMQTDSRKEIWTTRFVNHLACSKLIHEYGDQKHRGTGGRVVSGSQIGNRAGCQWYHVTSIAALMTFPFLRDGSYPRSAQV